MGKPRRRYAYSDHTPPVDMEAEWFTAQLAKLQRKGLTFTEIATEKGIARELVIKLPYPKT